MNLQRTAARVTVTALVLTAALAGLARPTTASETWAPIASVQLDQRAFDGGPVPDWNPKGEGPSLSHSDTTACVEPRFQTAARAESAVETPAPEFENRSNTYLNADRLAELPQYIAAGAALRAPDATSAMTVVEGLRNLDVQCAEQEIGSALHRSYGFESVPTPALHVERAAGLGDEAAFIRMIVDTSTMGMQGAVSLYFESTIVRVRDGIAMLSTTSVNRPFPEDERVFLARLLVQRLDQALGTPPGTTPPTTSPAKAPTDASPSTPSTSPAPSAPSAPSSPSSPGGMTPLEGLAIAALTLLAIFLGVMAFLPVFAGLIAVVLGVLSGAAFMLALGLGAHWGGIV